MRRTTLFAWQRQTPLAAPNGDAVAIRRLHNGPKVAPGATERALSGNDDRKALLPVLIDPVFGAVHCLTGRETELVLARVAHCQPDHEVQGCRYCEKEFSDAVDGADEHP